MSKFVKLRQKYDDQDIYVNIDNISAIWPNGRVICLNGNHYHENGIITLEQESMDLLVAIIEMVNDEPMGCEGTE